jgi:anti-sigma-K factor RskA
LNTQDYISSGIIERYLLGELSEKECLEVVAISNQYPEIKFEIEAVEDALMQLGSKIPPQHLKPAILSKLEIKDTKVIPMNRKNSSTILWFAAASIALLMISAAYNIVLMNRLKTSESKLAILQSEKDIIAKNFEIQSASYSSLNAEFAITTKPENKRVILLGLDVSPSSMAAIYWNQKTQDVYLSVNSLPIHLNDQQYQLWAIVDGKPVDAGVFELTNEFASLQKMKSIKGAQAFAVTLEKKGGNTSPNLNAMYLLGNV